MLGHRQVQPGNLSLHVVEGRSSGNPIVLFLHGWPQDWTAFQSVLGGLSKRLMLLNQAEEDSLPLTRDTPAAGAGSAPLDATGNDCKSAHFQLLTAHTNPNAPTSQRTKGTGLKPTGEGTQVRLLQYRMCSTRGHNCKASGPLCPATAHRVDTEFGGHKCQDPSLDQALDPTRWTLPESHWHGVDRSMIQG
jgi:hypothetical protein